MLGLIAEAGLEEILEQRRRYTILDEVIQSHMPVCAQIKNVVLCLVWVSAVERVLFVDHIVDTAAEAPHVDF